MTRADAIGKLRQAKGALQPGNEVYDTVVRGREETLARFQPILSMQHVGKLSRDEFVPFLYLENNHHWSGLYRQGLRTAENVGNLRKALRALLDESRPISERFTEALAAVTGLGKGLATAILTVAYPDKYGVWNNTSEGGLKQLGLWPEMPKGIGPGGRYERINDVLCELAAELEVDLWTLDALWWAVAGRAEAEPSGSLPGVGGEIDGSGLGTFALEQQLEKFLVENWARTSLGKEWSIYSTEEDGLAGNQFPTEIGRIDILARHKTERRWLVIELKRNQTSDQTIGQALRYMAWVQRNLANKGESVEALLIAHSLDKQGAYALTCVPGVRAMLYEVEFRLAEFDSEKAIGR